MNVVLGVLGSLGGVAVFVASVWAVVRTIFRQINAVEANTRSLDRLTKQAEHLDGSVDELRQRVARLEGRQ